MPSKLGPYCSSRRLKSRDFCLQCHYFGLGFSFLFKAPILLWTHCKNKRRDPPMADVGKTYSFLAREGQTFSTQYGDMKQLLLRAIQKHYPSVTTSGCYFHTFPISFFVVGYFFGNPSSWHTQSGAWAGVRPGTPSRERPLQPMHWHVDERIKQTESIWQTWHWYEIMTDVF